MFFYRGGENMKRVIFMAAAGLLASGLLGCFSGGEFQTSQNPAVSALQRQGQSQQGESQLEKFQRLLLADEKKLVVGSDNRTTLRSIEAVFQPQIISVIDEITEAKLSEPGRPYYFKLRAIYKGYDASAKRARLQDSAPGAALGGDTDVYSTYVLGNDGVISTFPPDANSIATFYLIAVHLTENEGRKINETDILIRFVRDIEPPPFDPVKFIVTGGMHYITVEDAHVPTQADARKSHFFGGAAGNSTSSVFDPVVYSLVDLRDARVAMDKKNIRDNYTFPAVKIKYVSEVVFRGQSSTTITVSTDDNVLTERMSFTGRNSTVKAGDKIRVYYTIVKDPLEKWEIQAIERR
jgi:hypothetical protein